MKNIKMVKILLFFTLFLFTIFFNNLETNATDLYESISPTNSGGGSGCMGVNCYSIGTSGIRITFLNSSGDKVGSSKDYWYFDSNVGRFRLGQGEIVVFKNIGKKGKNFKQDFKNLKLKDVKASIKSVKSYKFSSINNLLPDILGFASDLKNYYGSGKYYHSKTFHYDWNDTGKYYYDSGYKSNEATGLNTRIPNINNIIKNRIIDNSKKKTNYGGNKQEKYYYLNELAKNLLGYNDDKNGKAWQKIPTSYTIEIEPLVAIENRLLTTDNASSNRKQNYQFYGTITEAYYLFNSVLTAENDYFCKNKIVKYNSKWGYFQMCADKNGKNPGYQSAFEHVTAEQLYKHLEYGIYTESGKKDTIPNNILSYANPKKLPSLYNFPNSTAAVGVGFISMSNFFTKKPCEDLASSKSLKTTSIKEYVDGLKVLVNKNEGWVDSYNWMYNATNYGIKDAKKLQSFIKSTNSCLVPKCEDLYTKVYDSNYNTFKSKVPIYADSTQKNLIKNYSDARWNYVIHDAISSFKITSANVCKATRCSDILVNQELNTKKYNQLDSDKKKIINIMNTNKTLYADFNYKYLNEDILKILNVKAACDGKSPNCKNIDNISKCESPYNISIGKKSENDETYKNECILNGFLYNIGGKYYRSVNNKYTGYLDQSSLYTVYCSEKIDIEMPKINSSYTKAGRVFQWGNNIKTETNTGADSDTKNFATMTVVQQCYKGNKVPNGKSIGFSPNERKKFKQLNDSLSTSNGQISSTTMDFTYKEPTGKFKFNNLSYDRKLVSRKVAPSSSVIEITSVYDFDYSRKMTWYSHKGNSEEDMIDKNDYNNLSNIQKNEYLFIGYGAPTSFNTADGTYKESITATIKNIGVSGEYKHLYSSDILEYKCDFKIHNEIIGNECCDVSKGKPFPGAPSYCTCDGGKEPKGLDVAFRTIQLVNKNASSSSINSEISKAFPGRTGAGRNLTGNVGKNWKTLIDSDTKTVLNILRDDIYSGAPQYTISLDVRKISAIRESNKALRDESIDPYTYRGKVKNGTGYTCYENGKYGYCRSEFVKEYLEGKCATRSGTLETKPCE